MRKVKIITDSTTSLPKEMLKERGIDVVPSHIILGNKGYIDDGSITTKELFEFAESTGTLPKTTPPTVREFQSTFQKWLGEDYDIFFTCISGKIALSIKNAESAISGLVPGRISIVDTLSASAGTGLQVLEAADLADKGAGLLEVTNHAYALRDKVQSSMVLDTLKYLYMGGRCSRLTSIVGETLNIKPTIDVKDGEMVPGENLRGKRYIDKYIEKVMENPERIDPKRIFVTHCFCEEVGEAKERLVNGFGFKNVIVSDIPPTTSVHVGPGSLGIMFMYK